MLLNKFLRFLNYLIAVLLVGAALAVYWYAYRPLPQTSGSIATRVGAAVTVDRDSLGVPHIRAASVEDLMFAQGFVTAQERLWQMDLLRRFASGQLAEVLGQVGAESDQEMRRLRTPAIAGQQAALLPASDRAVITAYARGVNAFIAHSRGRLPLEFTVLGYDPRPWTVSDSLLVSLVMFRNLTATWKDEILKSKLLAGADPAKVDFLFPVRTGLEFQPGSNAWALAGSRTASGRPLLANDPHLENSVPSIWFMNHLTAPGVNVTGVSVPGIPAVLIGHNDRIAWGITNLHFDVQDLYEEKIDFETGRYLYKGQMEQARQERQWIAVRDAQPIRSFTWVTRHGPVFLADGGKYYSLRWSVADPGLLQFPFLDINRAGNWQEFTAALARMTGPASNVIYADVDGNIGYHAAGKLPIRRNYNGDTPVDGSSGEFEWDGYIPFDQLPSAWNPPSGMIISANQNPFPAAYAYRVNGNFAPQYRSGQIRAMLAARSGWKAGEMLTVQKDVYSPFSHFLARQAVAAYDRAQSKPAGLEEAVKLLRSWNGQMEIGQPAPLLMNLFYDELKSAMAESASPDKGAEYKFHMASAAVEQLLRQRPAGWFLDYDRMLLRCFTDAFEQGKRMQGRNPSKWDYGRSQPWTLTNPVISRLPLVGSYFNIGPEPMSGSSYTVKQINNKLGPSMRMTVDLADLDRSLQNLVTGQSGHVLSSHFKDQWTSFYYGRSFPMQFRKVESKNRLTLEPAR
ncbi:MAG: penicillin acylase family protein [Acidobacteria bacterium]|nr:penicillin acylase family protein [Acidobacteriota bacterium]